jgi:hypothetical protein
MLIAGLFVGEMGVTAWAQEPGFFQDRQPSDLFWFETLVGTVGAYVGGLAGAYSGALIGGCFAASGQDEVGLFSPGCLISALVGGVIGSAIGATTSLALTAGFNGIEGNIFLALVGASGGELIGLMITAYLVPPTVPTLVSWTIPSMTSSLFATMGFNVGAKFRDAVTSASPTLACLRCHLQSFFTP